MDTNNTSPLTREQVRTILHARKGSIKHAAQALNISGPAVSQWLNNRSNIARLDRELPAFAAGFAYGIERASF